MQGNPIAIYICMTWTLYQMHKDNLNTHQKLHALVIETMEEGISVIGADEIILYKE